MNQYDFLVIGAGPAGGTATLLLARHGYRVALAERKAFPRKKVCGEYLSATNLPLLESLGIASVFRTSSGPEVVSVGLFAGESIVTCPIPRPGGYAAEGGRALSREALDPLLVSRGVEAGATVYQPVSVEGMERISTGFRCRLVHRENKSVETIEAKQLVLGHGSWEVSGLPSQPAKDKTLPDDLLGFKAHFFDSTLDRGLMPLLAYPGGYGGMVEVDRERMSLSCCIKRGKLDELRRQNPGRNAGDVVLSHIVASCRGVRESMESARIEGDWLAAGPIRPQIRLRDDEPGIWRVGNAAGEAHPAVAEGISMAMQSGWLMLNSIAGTPDTERAQMAYRQAWRASFAPRLRASRFIAHWAMRSWTVRASVPLIRRFPGLLQWGASLSGKDTRVVRETASPQESRATSYRL